MCMSIVGGGWSENIGCLLIVHHTLRPRFRHCGRINLENRAGLRLYTPRLAYRPFDDFFLLSFGFARKLEKIDIPIQCSF